MTSTLSAHADVTAPADKVWALVSDLPGMGRLSPENTGGRWLRGATGPAVGARFRGSNRNGWRRWSTSVRVTACTPGQAFGFDVSFAGIPVSAWAYDLAPSGDGCTVTETWTDRRPRWFAVVSGVTTGVSDRRTATLSGLEQTLAAVKRTAEHAG